MNNKKIKVFISTIVVVVVLLLIVFSPEESEQGLTESKTVTVPVSVFVSVLELEPSSFRSTITVMGEVVPQWQTIVKTQAYGQIVSLSPKFKVGEIVEKDEILIRIEDHQLSVNVAEAELELINAKINLLNEELLQRKAFLEAARKEFDVADKRLESANIELEKSIIKAPYNGLIVERFVNEGDVLFAGDQVTLLYGTGKSIVSIFLDNSEWSFLPKNLDDIEVTLIDNENGNKWSASVTRDGKILNRDSRLRPLFIEIDNPLQLNPSLLTGTFLSVQLKCDYIKDLLEIPQSAYTNSGYIWFIEDNKLQSVKVDLVFRENNYIYIKKPEIIPYPILIANTPNSAFINGMTVSPKIIKGDK